MSVCLCVCVSVTTDRPTDRPADRPTDRPTNRSTDRPTVILNSKFQTVVFTKIDMLDINCKLSYEYLSICLWVSAFVSAHNFRNASAAAFGGGLVGLPYEFLIHALCFILKSFWTDRPSKRPTDPSPIWSKSGIPSSLSNPLCFLLHSSFKSDHGRAWPEFTG